MTSMWRNVRRERGTASALALRLVHAEEAESREIEQARALIALRALRPREQAALELIYWEYLEHASAAMLLGSTSSAFEILLRRGTYRMLHRIRDDTVASSSAATHRLSKNRPLRVIFRPPAVVRLREFWNQWRQATHQPVAPDDERALRSAMESARQAAGHRPSIYDPRRLRMSNGVRSDSTSPDRSWR